MKSKFENVPVSLQAVKLDGMSIIMLPVALVLLLDNVTILPTHRRKN